jgi:hypothetical protein
VHVESVEWTHRADPEDWWSGPANGIGALGLIMEGLSPAEIARIRAAYDRLTTEFLGDGGLLELPTAALLGSGVRPD